MADITCSNTELKVDYMTALTWNAATETVNDTVQNFVITPAVPSNRALILIQHDFATAGALAYAITDTSTPFGLSGNSSSLTISGSISADEAVLRVDGQCLEKGKLTLAFTPASGMDLTNDHALNVAVVVDA